MRFTCVLLLLSAVAISADLQSDFNDIIDQLPKERITQIAQEYAASDPRFRSGLSFLQGFNIQRFLGEFLETEEVKKIFDYFKDRGIDFKVILFRFIPELLGQPSILEILDSSANQINADKPLLSGDFVTDFLKVMPSGELSALIQQKIVTSPEFANFAEAVQDPKFKKLFYRAMNSKAIHGNFADSNSLNVRGFWSNLFRGIVAFFKAFSN